MRTRLLVTAMAAALAAASAPGAMITARWGVKGKVQHPGALSYEAAGKGQTVLAADLSALPKAAEVYRARLLFFGVNWKEKGFDIVPARRQGEGDGAKLEATGERLKVVPPWNAWLDATDAVRARVKDGGGKVPLRLWMRSGRSFDRDRTVLEIAYEGKAAGRLPEQVTGVKALHRAGQVFVTFRETNPPDGGKDEVTVGELAKRMKADYYRPVRTGPLAYRVYRHDEPITSKNIGRAELLGVALPGSAYNTRFAFTASGRRKGMWATGISGKPRRPDALGVRAAIEDGRPLPAGTGLYVDTPEKAGRHWYAVLSAAGGATNAEVSEANTAGPVAVRPGPARPVLYKDIVKKVGDAEYHEQWYSFWTAQPLSVVPSRYDVVVQHCPAAMAKPARLYIHRHGWNSWPRPGRPGKIDYIRMAHTADQPVDFRLGLHDSIDTLKGFDQGTWKPFHSNRQRALVAWMQRTWPIDGNRIHVGLAAWGMWEIKDGDLYAYIHGWGQPELTKGFQCWDRARGIWGPPEMYKGRPDEENPYVACNFTDWVLKHPEAELPFFVVHAGGGSHYTEMGWAPQPRFCWAMMRAKQPFILSTGRSPAGSAAGRLAGRRDRSVPALANCSLDDNIGSGDIRSGSGWGSSQVNGYVMWDPETITDKPGEWAITLWVDESSYFDEGRVDMTPRRCQKFKAGAGQTFAWTNAVLPAPPAEPDEGAAKGEDKDKAAKAAKPAKKVPAPKPKVVDKGVVTADAHGLVTIRQLKVSKARHRVTLRRK